MQKKHLIGYPVTALIALGIGAAGSSGGTDTASGTSAPTTTVTAPPATVTATAGSAPVTTTATKTVTAKPAVKASFPGDGTYQVGVDIKAGTYVSAKPDSGNCYWARLKGSDTFSDIIANNNTAGQSVVTIKSTDKFFETNGCSDWHMR